MAHRCEALERVNQASDPGVCGRSRQAWASGVRRAGRAGSVCLVSGRREGAWTETEQVTGQQAWLLGKVLGLGYRGGSPVPFRTRWGSWE